GHCIDADTLGSKLARQAFGIVNESRLDGPVRAGSEIYLEPRDAGDDGNGWCAGLFEPGQRRVHCIHCMHHVSPERLLPSLRGIPDGDSAAASVTSNALPHAGTPFSAIARTAAATSSALRAHSATLAPSLANISAIARPMPLLPPVITTFFPFNPRSMASSIVSEPGRAAPAQRLGAIMIFLIS